MTIQSAKNVLEFAKTELANEFKKAKSIALSNLESKELGYDQDDYDETITAINRILTLEPNSDANVVLVRQIAELEQLIGADGNGICSNNSVIAVKLMTLGTKSRLWK